MWQELRKLESGELVYGVTDAGEREDGDSFPDDDVAAMAIASLYSHRRLIVLTADGDGNLDGLPYLLLVR